MTPSSSPPEVNVGRVGADEWTRIRSLRLASLLDSPDAFWALYDDWAEWDEAAWRRTAEDSAWFAARLDQADVGIVAGIDSPEWGEPGGRLLAAMWVAPVARGTPAAGMLVEAVCGWAKSDGAASVTLWVAGGNDRARAFYGRMGFVPTGRTAPLRAGSPIVTEECRRTL